MKIYNDLATLTGDGATRARIEGRPPQLSHNGRRRSSRRFRFSRWPGLVFALTAAAGCGSGEPAAPPAPQVTVATPVRRPVQRYAEFTGTTVAVAYAEIRARVPGLLTEVRFSPGGLVKKEEILFVIEREQYLAARDEAVGALRSAEAELARAESDLERVQQAIKTNAVSQSDLDRARADRDQAEAAVISARARLDKAELDLSYTLVRSPVDGQVGRNLVDVGNLVGTTGPTLLTTVNKLDPIFVYFDSPELLVLKLLALRRPERSERSEAADEVGRVDVSLSNETDFPHEGHIDFIDNTVDPTTGTIELRAVLENADTVIFPGLFVRIRVYGEVEPNALVIDERAVGSDLGGKYVYVLDAKNVVEQRYIELGPLQDDGMIVVERGLEGNERYVVNGLLRARPGFPVAPLSAAEEG